MRLTFAECPVVIQMKYQWHFSTHAIDVVVTFFGNLFTQFNSLSLWEEEEGEDLFSQLASFPTRSTPSLRQGSLVKVPALFHVSRRKWQIVSPHSHGE